VRARKEIFCKAVDVDLVGLVRRPSPKIRTGGVLAPRGQPETEPTVSSRGRRRDPDPWECTWFWQNPSSAIDKLFRAHWLFVLSAGDKQVQLESLERLDDWRRTARFRCYGRRLYDATKGRALRSTQFNCALRLNY
jgi:hypothetical protein